MKRLRVLHPITRLIVGGAQENTMYTAALLDRSRFEVHVLCGPQTGSEGSLIEEARARGVELKILPELVREISPTNDLIALWKMTRLIRSGRFDIVHTHSSKAGLLGRLAARLAGTPVIIHTVHGWSFHDRMSPWRRKAYIFFERLAASITTAMIAVTHTDIEKGLKAGIGRPEQYTLIRSAIPLVEFDPTCIDRAAARRSLGFPEGASVLGNVGRFSPQKNPLDWVRVAGKVAHYLPDCRFLLVGDGPLREEVADLIAKEGLEGRFVLPGLRREVSTMLAAIDVFLLTSLWEGLPRVLPQAMAMGLPVVASRVNGSSEIIEHGANGFLFDPDDLNGMAKACTQLLSDEPLRRQMGRQGIETARSEFDLRLMISQIEKLYSALCQ